MQISIGTPTESDELLRHQLAKVVLSAAATWFASKEARKAYDWLLEQYRSRQNSG